MCVYERLGDQQPRTDDHKGEWREPNTLDTLHTAPSLFVYGLMPVTGGNVPAPQQRCQRQLTVLVKEWSDIW